MLLTSIESFINRRWNVVVLLLLTSAVFLRGIYANNFVLGFDQVQILEKVHEILQGNLTLIGPRTGPAHMFTGPLIYYFSVPFVMMFGDFTAVIVIPLVFSLISGMTLYVLLKRYLGRSEALLGLTFWTFSPLLISLDRVLWNPALTVLAASLLFIPLLGKKNDWITVVLVFTGAFLSYQSHFSGFLLVAFTLITILVLKKPWRILFAILLGFGCSLLPSIVFDVRNQFLNAQGLMDFLSRSSNFTFEQLIEQLWQTTFIVSNFYGSIFLWGNSLILLSTIGVTLLFSSAYLIKLNRNLSVAFFWVLFSILIYTFYSGEKPEYYFLYIVPALLSLSVVLFPKIGKAALIFSLIIFITYAVLTTLATHKVNQNLSISVLRDIRSLLQKQSVKAILYDIKQGQEFGVKYALKSIPLTDSGDIIHISYPNDLTLANVKVFGNVGVWIDPRESGKNYVSTNDYILSMSPATNVLLMSTPEPPHVARYAVMHESVDVGVLIVSDCTNSRDQKQNAWINNSPNEYQLHSSRKCLSFVSEDREPDALDISLVEPKSFTNSGYIE